MPFIHKPWITRDPFVTSFDNIDWQTAPSGVYPVVVVVYTVVYPGGGTGGGYPGNGYRPWYGTRRMGPGSGPVQ